MRRTSLLALLLAFPLFALAADAPPSDLIQAVLDRLKLGNDRFVNDAPSPADVTSLRREILTPGQHPFCTVLGCSDSRVTPEHLFEAGLGDVFDVRGAGNIADETTIPSIEYGVQQLETHVVVVLGHSDCGAIKAWLSGNATWPSLDALLAKIGPPKDKTHTPGSPDDAARANVSYQIGKLVKSPVIAKALADKTVVIKGAFYDLESGEVTWLDEGERGTNPNPPNGKGPPQKPEGQHPAP
jgi:carbonic anhydrase